MKTGFEAVKPGLIAFLAPLFLFEPALPLNGEPLVILQASAAVGLIALAAGPQGCLLRRCALWQRILLAANGILLILPGCPSDVAAFGVLVAVLFPQLLLNTPARRKGGMAREGMKMAGV